MRSRRQGYTLIEMLIVLTLTGTALGIAAVMMHSLHRAERHLRDEMQDYRTLDQLATRLRQDAHRAEKASVSDSQTTRSTTVLLTLADGHTITYSVGSFRIDREEQLPDQSPHRDAFSFHRLAGRSCALDVDGRRPRITLRMTMDARHPEESGGGPGNELQIAAVVGMHLEEHE